MNVGIVKAQTPFVRDPADEAAESLAAGLSEQGHDAEVIRIPFRADPPERILEHLLAVRLLKLPTVDRVVALGFPAFCVEHAVKFVWLVGDSVLKLPDTPEGHRIAEAVAGARRLHLAKARRVFGADETVNAVVVGVVA